MADKDDLVELLFFDTFSHEIHEDLNLDLVQFPKPVYITEVRIIPLGARVQADFPGGVRLGATNPSKFGIEFFVNDLGKPGASTFENLGTLGYNQNDCIHLECENDKIPTDGLVLRGWYTTITLAVYGTLTKNLTEQIASPPPPIETVPEEVAMVPVPLVTGETQPEWRDDAVTLPATVEVAIFERDPPPEIPFVENFEQAQYTDDSYYQTSSQDGTRDVEKRVSRRKSRSSERSTSRNRTYSRSDSTDRDYAARQKREWSRSPEYRHSRRLRRDRSRDVSEHSEREHKWPRTPPPAQVVDSPRRPRSPEQVDQFSDIGEDSDFKYRQKTGKPTVAPSPTVLPETLGETADEIQEPPTLDDDTMSQDEQFEPILSDDEIGDDDINDEPETDDIEMEEIDFDDVVRPFDPFKMPVMRFDIDMNAICSKDIDIIQKLLRKYETQTQVQSQQDFINSTGDEKENFVYLSEQMIAYLNQVNLMSFQRRNYVLEKTLKEHLENLKLMSNIFKVAVDFDCACAQLQPGQKMRHIKIGARIAELVGVSSDFLNYYVNVEGLDPFKSLFSLYEQNYMALSIKLMILKAIYAILDTKFGVNVFLINKLNGYQRLLIIMQSNPLTRAKFAIKSIIKKVNLFESLETVQDLVTKLFVLTNHFTENSYENLELCLLEIKNALTIDALGYQQPKRFLPVSEKFEIFKDITAQKSWSHMLQSYFKANAFCESLLLLVSNLTDLPTSLVDIVFDIIEILTRSIVGIDYLIEDCFETTNLLIKCLLGIEDQTLDPDENDKKIETNLETKEKSQIKLITRPVTRSEKLGFEIAIMVQTRYHVDAVTYIKDNLNLLVEHLHSLYGQLCYHPARIFTIQTLILNSNVIPFLNLIEKERKTQSQRQHGSPAVKYKSPVLSYAVDIIDYCVRYSLNLGYLVEHGSIILELVKNHEIFEPSVSAVLQEMSVYLKPMEIANNFSYDDISQLCELIKRGLEYITTFPGDLIMSLRILKHLGVGDDFANERDTKELKNRYVILQFYSADGIVTLLNILEKLNTYYEQPGLHSATLMTTQAIQTCQILLPALKILREMLTFVIKCRDTQFKDLTAIEHLMRTYCLMHYYPEMSPAYDDAQKIKTEIIQILLAYTQPNPQDEESVHKSLWTQMIREIIKFILTGPSTFIPGLQAFAELLPLPLPVQSLHSLSSIETQRLITERKLWSAHLHPQSSSIADMIQTICPSSFPQLIDLLTRVCLQLADLAPNMTLLISKTIIDMILSDSNSSSSVGTRSLGRLLKFLGQLTAYASVKISSLSIFFGRLYDYFNQILTNPDKSEPHIQCQLSIHRILENFLDSEISIISPNSTGNAELNLACSLPSKELIPGIVSSVLINLFNSEISSSITTVTIYRNLMVLTENDITFYHLRNILDSKKEQYQEWLNKMAEAHTKGVQREILGCVIIFLKALIYIDDCSADSTLPNRTLKLNIQELGTLIGWTGNKENIHPLQKIKEFLQNNSEDENEILRQDLTSLLDNLENFDPLNIGLKTDITEPTLPQAEGIVTQYLSRPIYTIYDSTSDDPQLSADFWLEPIRLNTLSEKILSESERISCDLSEMVNSCLPPDTNLTADCKRILHLSASPQSNRERTTTAPCFRTRRVEVEPTARVGAFKRAQTGKPGIRVDSASDGEKKIFVTPMRGRGFPRAPPTRGDLFRSRPPNTSRPPSLHVDDFLALETCGAQPTGPTGYNKLSRDIISIRGSRVGRSRGGRISTLTSASYRKFTSNSRTGSPNTWSHISVGDPNVAPPPQHFRTATSEPVVTQHFTNDPHYSQPHFGGPPLRSRGRGRARTFMR